MKIFDQLLFEISSRMEEAEREKDVKGMMGFIRLGQELLRSDKYFPCMFIAEGITTYIKGFYVASIFYSSLSVEMGLLIEINKKLAGINDEDKRKLRRTSGLIEEAYRLGILDREHRQLVHKIRKLRNCYVHFYNILHYRKQFIENLRPIIPSKEEQRRAIQTIIEITEKSMPNIPWAANPEAVQFARERGEEYSKLLIKELATGSDTKRLSEELKDMGKAKFRSYRYEQKRIDAHDMLRWCWEILRSSILEMNGK